jgi:hypothetical protein
MIILSILLSFEPGCHSSLDKILCSLLQGGRRHLLSLTLDLIYLGLRGELDIHLGFRGSIIFCHL